LTGKSHYIARDFDLIRFSIPGFQYMGLPPNSCATHEFPLATESPNRMFEPASAKIRAEMVEVKAEVCDVGVH